VANCNRVVVVMALVQPDLDPIQLTRFLLTAEATGVQVDLVLTKADLLAPERLEEWRQRLATWGYDPWLVSAQTGVGIEPLRQHLAAPGIAVLCGPSGVGKSSLLNALVPDLALRVGAVSGRLQRGRHTTRHVELFAIGAGGLLADTPGFNRPDLPPDPGALAGLFPEVRGRLGAGGCRFTNCLHQGDPGCAVGSDWPRYPHYLQCLDQVLAQEAAAKSRPAEPGLKQRGGRSEPRLDPRLRQLSRKRRRQGDGLLGEGVDLLRALEGGADVGHGRIADDRHRHRRSERQGRALLGHHQENSRQQARMDNQRDDKGYAEETAFPAHQGCRPSCIMDRRAFRPGRSWARQCL
jgi:ribosome biogenesis GTPase